MRLFLFMALVTAIEVVLIAKVGALIGFFPTLIIIILTALVGSQQLKKQWQFVMSKLQTLSQDPSQALLEALILLICGVLLITPGFLTDLVGFLGLIPVVRQQLADRLKQQSGRVFRGGFQVYTGDYHNKRTQSANNEQVIEGEFERKPDQ